MNMKKTKLIRALGLVALLGTGSSAMAQTTPAGVDAIIDAGTTIAGYAGAAGAAGVLIAVAIWGIRYASKAFGAAK